MWRKKWIFKCEKSEFLNVMMTWLHSLAWTKWVFNYYFLFVKLDAVILKNHIVNQICFSNLCPFVLFTNEDGFLRQKPNAIILRFLKVTVWPSHEKCVWKKNISITWSIKNGEFSEVKSYRISMITKWQISVQVFQKANAFFTNYQTQM